MEINMPYRHVHCIPIYETNEVVISGISRRELTVIPQSTSKLLGLVWSKHPISTDLHKRLGVAILVRYQEDADMVYSPVSLLKATQEDDAFGWEPVGAVDSPAHRLVSYSVE